MTANGGSLNYRWRKDGVDLVGATNASYNLPLAHTNQAGSYIVVVSNPSGIATSAPPAVLTVDPTGLGTVVAWGLNWAGQTNVPAGARSAVTAIAAGSDHSMALKDDGSVLAWGDNWAGQATVPPGLSGVIAISAGADHSAALKNDGSVVAWGANFSGQTNVPLAAQSGVIAIAAGFGHTVALKSDNTVVAWGRSGLGQTMVPLGLNEVIAIAAGADHTLAVTRSGVVEAWGYNFNGETTVPSELSAVTRVAGGYNHSMALVGTGQAMPVPLNITTRGREVVLSWATSALGFTLQATTNLAPPVIWIDSTNPPALLGAESFITNALSGNARYYRLRKP